jgi:hypothetical protein
MAADSYESNPAREKAMATMVNDKQQDKAKTTAGTGK